MKHIVIHGPTVRFFPNLVPLTGSVKAALLLSRMIEYELEATSPGGWFSQSPTNWDNELGLSLKEVATARKTLRQKGFITEELHGCPPCVLWKVNTGAIASMATQLN